MFFEEENFSSPPNFKYEETISKESDCLSNCNTFDLYKEKNNDIILITPCIDPINFNNEEFNINLINLNNNEITKKLSGHKDRILSVKLFQNPKTKNIYLLSVDKGHNIIIWDIEKNFQKIFEKKFEYELNTFIYSALIIFGESNTWVVASSISEKNKTLVIDMSDMNKSENFVEIKESENIPIYCLLYWFNKNEENEKDKHNIIQCGKNRILITQFPSDTTYYSIHQNPIKYYSGCIIYQLKEKDYLAISSCSGSIIIFDLEEKNIVKNFDISGGVHLFSFIKWNENYLMVIDTRNKKLIIMNMDNNYKIVSRNYLPELGIGVYMKKLRHPKYGESVLISGKDWTIKLFTLKGVMRSIDDDDYE